MQKSHQSQGCQTILSRCSPEELFLTRTPIFESSRGPPISDILAGRRTRNPRRGNTKEGTQLGNYVELGGGEEGVRTTTNSGKNKEREARQKRGARKREHRIK